MNNPWWTPYVALFAAFLATITFLWNIGREWYDRRRKVKVDLEVQHHGTSIEVAVKVTNLSPKVDVEVDQIWLRCGGLSVRPNAWQESLPRRLPASGIARFVGTDDALTPAEHDLLHCEGIEVRDSRGRTYEIEDALRTALAQLADLRKLPIRPPVTFV